MCNGKDNSECVAQALTRESLLTWRARRLPADNISVLVVFLGEAVRCPMCSGDQSHGEFQSKRRFRGDGEWVDEGLTFSQNTPASLQRTPCTAQPKIALLETESDSNDREDADREPAITEIPNVPTPPVSSEEDCVSRRPTFRRNVLADASNVRC